MTGLSNANLLESIKNEYVRHCFKLHSSLCSKWNVLGCQTLAFNYDILRFDLKSRWRQICLRYIKVVKISSYFKLETNAFHIELTKVIRLQNSILVKFTDSGDSFD